MNPQYATCLVDIKVTRPKGQSGRGQAEIAELRIVSRSAPAGVSRETSLSSRKLLG